jgi:hypothetical protein
MAEKTILVCDVCGEHAQQTVALLIGRRRLLKDYCARHLGELINGARGPRGVGSRRTATPKATRRKRATAPSTRGTRSRTDANKADVAAEAKKLRSKGMSYRQIGDALLERGMNPPRAKAWNPVVLGRILKRSAA